MTQAINTQVINALNSATAYAAAIAKLRTTFRGQLSPDVRTGLLPYVAAYYKVAVVDGKRGSGLDQGATKYEAARKALQRLTKDIVGASAAHTEPTPLTRAQLALIKQCHAAGITMRMFGQGVASLK
jgi:hypothetical protein